MSYEIYIDVRHHPRHNEDDERKVETALRLADEDGTLARAFDSDDDAPIRSALAKALHGFADEVSPDGGYIYVIAFDQDVFGLFWTEEAAEADLTRQINGGGPAWDGCSVERWRVHA